MANLVKFKTGSRAQYEALTTKDSNTLYFLSDTFQIMKGSDLYCKSFVTVSSLPTNDSGVKDTLYIVKNDKKLYTFNGTGFVEAFDASVATSVTADGTNPVTSAAIYSFVTNEIANITGGSTNAFVTSVAAKEGTPGVLTVKNGEGENGITTDVTLKGLAKTPTYDATTRKFTFPVVGGDDLVVNLGKDLVVTDGTYDATADKIILTIAGGGEGGTNKTIEIPVGDLVDTYTASADTSKAAKITITDNAISAAVIVDGSTINISESGQLTANFSTLVTNATFADLEKKVTANEKAIGTLTGDFNTKVESIEGRLGTIEGDITSIETNYVKTADLTSSYYDKSTIDTKVSALTTSINGVQTNLDNALTWVTIE